MAGLKFATNGSQTEQAPADAGAVVPADKKEEHPVTDFLSKSASMIFNKAIPTAVRATEAGIGMATRVVPEIALNVALGKGAGAGLEATKKYGADVMAGKEGVSPFVQKAVSAFGGGLTGGYVEPDTTELNQGVPEYLKKPLDFVDNALVAGAGALGTVTRYYGLGKLIGAGTDKLAPLQKIASRFPTLARYVGPVLNSSATFGVAGQLEKATSENPDLNQRVEKLKTDLKTGTVFGLVQLGLGGTRAGLAATKMTPELQKVVSSVIEYPTMFTLGYKMASEGNPNATTEDRVIGGLVLAGLHYALGYPDRPVSVGREKPLSAPSSEEVNILLKRLGESTGATGEKLGELPSPGAMEKSGVQNLSLTVDKVGDEMRALAPGKAAKTVGQDISASKYLSQTGMVAQKFQQDFKLPTFDTYRMVEEASGNADRFIGGAVDVGKTLLPKQALGSVDARINVGKLGIALEDANVSVNSPQAKKIAAQMGLGETELQAVKNFQDFWTKYFFPIAKAINPNLELKDNYWVYIQKADPTDVNGKYYEDVPTDVAFGVKKRGPDTGNRIEDPLVLTQLYARQIARKAYFQPAVDHYNGYADALPQNVRGRMDEFVNANIGKRDRSGGIILQGAKNLDAFLNKTFEPILAEGKKFNIASNFDSLSSILYSSMYAGALGYQNVKSLAFNGTQPVQFLIPEAGPKITPFLANAYAKVGNVNAWNNVMDRGWVKDVNAPADQVLREYRYSQAGTLDRAAMEISDVNDIALTGFKKADMYARVVSAIASSDQFNAALPTFRKSGFDAFAKQLDLVNEKGQPKFYSEPELAELRKHLEEGNIGNAEDAYVKSRLRWTNFSQLTGEFPGNALVDFGGKSNYAFKTYSLSAANVALRRWNVMQKALYIGTALGLVQAYRQLGVETKKNLGPFSLTSVLDARLPVAQMALSTLAYAQAMSSGNAKLEDDQAAQLRNSFKIFKYPEVRVEQFIKSGQNGWMWYDTSGRPIAPSNEYNAWLRLVGFQPVQDAIYYDSLNFKTKLQLQDQAKRKELGKYIVAGNTAKITQFLNENPEYAPLLQDRSWVSNQFIPRAAKPLEGVSKKDIPEYLEETKKIEERYPTRTR